MRVRGALAAAMVTASVLASSGCSKPVTPTVSSVKPTSVGVNVRGLTLGLALGLRNPNSLPIPLQSVTAHVVLDGNLDLGTGTVDEPVTLAANQDTNVSASVELPWKDMSQLASLVASGRDMKYKADGTVALGGDLLNVSVPFTTSGVLKQEDLARGAMQGLQGLPQLFPR